MPENLPASFHIWIRTYFILSAWDLEKDKFDPNQECVSDVHLRHNKLRLHFSNLLSLSTSRARSSLKALIKRSQR